MKKRLLIGTNTKMYKTIADTVDFLTDLKNLTSDIRDEIELFVIPSYTSLESARKSVSSEEILLGAQNMSWEDEGQFTGEISPVMLKEIGVDMIMIGHSERREIFKETDEEENKKVKAALNNGFRTLLCIGETGENKEKGISDEILRIQLKRGLWDVKAKDLKNLIIAYEPVWAIGVNGIPASAEYAQEKHQVIKEVLGEMYSQDAKQIPVLYGGSVNPGNAESLIIQKDIDGLFIGRSAWKAKEFNALIRQVLTLV